MHTLLPDGRRLTGAEYGDADGKPVVYLHGTPGCRLNHPPDGSLAGIRLVTLDRPGYGRSDPDPKPSLFRTANAVLALADMLGLAQFGVVGFSGGAPYALAAGARFPDRVTAVVAAGLTGPAVELGTANLNERAQTTLARVIPPLGRRAVTRAAAWFVEDPLRNHRRNLDSGVDRFMEMDQENNLEAARQGTAGLVGDWLATDIHPWGFRLADITVPVLIWAGRGDPGRAVSHAPLVAARIVGSQVRIAEDADHTPGPDHWRGLLDWVCAPRPPADTHP